MSRPSLTARQAAAWPDAIDRLRVHGFTIPADIASWSVDYADETRPGRGHSINAIFLDGEVFAQVWMDVYGYPNVSIAALDWIHADSNEDCDCDPCEAELAALNGGAE